LLSYVALPLLLFAITPFRAHLSGKRIRRVAAMVGVVVVVGLALANAARGFVYTALVEGRGYERGFAIDSETFRQGLNLGQFFFFERLSGARELEWVDAAVTKPRATDLWY